MERSLMRGSPMASVQADQSIRVKFLGITKTETGVEPGPGDAPGGRHGPECDAGYAGQVRRPAGKSHPHLRWAGSAHARIYLGNTDVDDLAGLDTPARGTDEMVLVSLAPLCGG